MRPCVVAKGALVGELRVAEVTLEQPQLVVHGHVALEVVRAVVGLAAALDLADELALVHVLLPVPAKLARGRERPLAALERADVGLEAGVEARVGLEPAGLLEGLAAAGPGAGQVLALVAVGAPVRDESAAGVVPLAAALVLAGVRGQGVVVHGLGVRLEEALQLECRGAAGHLAGYRLRPGVSLLVAR